MDRSSNSRQRRHLTDSVEEASEGRVKSNPLRFLTISGTRLLDRVPLTMFEAFFPQRCHVWMQSYHWPRQLNNKAGEGLYLGALPRLGSNVSVYFSPRFASLLT